MQYKCKICQMTTSSHIEIAKHLLNEHEEIPDEEKDETIEGIKKFVGINLPPDPIFKKLNELTTSWRGFEVLHAFSSFFTNIPFFTNSEEFQETQDLVEKSLSLSKTWANFLEEIYTRFKPDMKRIEKSTEELLKRESS